MTPLKKISKIPVLRNSIIIGALAISSASMVFTSCGSSETQYTEETKYELTQGLITEVEEVEKELFKITNETEVPQIEDSRIIASYIDGTRDTFTLEEAKLVDADSPTRRRSMNGVLMGGLMGYYMGRSLSSPVNRGAYKTPATYQKAAKTTSTLKQTAKRTTVRRPVNSSKGFGGGKSTRSFGG